MPRFATVYAGRWAPTARRQRARRRGSVSVSAGEGGQSPTAARLPPDIRDVVSVTGGRKKAVSGEVGKYMNSHHNNHQAAEALEELGLWER